MTNQTFETEARKKEKRKNRILIGIGIFILLWIAASIDKSDKKTPELQAQSKPVEQSFDSWLNSQELVDAIDITKVYQENEVKADRLYKGNNLHVYGIIESIEKDFMDNIIVRIKGYQYNDIMAYFEDTKAVGDLLKGDGLWFSGKCDGYLMNSSVVIKDCKIMQFAGVKR